MHTAWLVLVVYVPLLVARRSAPLPGGLPYAWGTYCGYAMLLAAAGELMELAAGSPIILRSWLLSAGEVLLSALAGVELLRRRQFGVAALFAAWYLLWLELISRFAPSTWETGSGVWYPRAAVVSFYSLMFAGLFGSSITYFRRRWPVLHP